MARFLLPEDDPDIRELCRIVLVLAGHVVDALEDGRQAADRVCQAEYDSIVSDGDMPCMDGFAFLQAVRSVVLGRVPFAFKSGCQPEGLVSEDPRMGAGWFLQKPFSREQLVKLSEEMLRVRVKWLLEAQPSIGLPPREDGKWVELENLEMAAGIAALPQQEGARPTGESKIIRAPSPKAAIYLLAGSVRHWPAMLDARATLDLKPVWAPALGVRALSSWKDHQVLLGDDQLRLESSSLSEPLRTRLYLALCCARYQWRWRVDHDVELVVDPPDEVHEVDGVLHCETGPALRYRDGWQVYALRGVRVSPRAIEDRLAG